MRFSHMSVLAFLVFGSCSYAKGLWTEPEPEDLMGDMPYLEQAGSNIEIDWGEGQPTVLNRLSALQEENSGLKQRLAAAQANRERLDASLEEVRKQIDTERNLRRQADADSDSLRGSRRELEAKILSLSIAMARLEQENLLLHIDRVTENLESLRVSSPIGDPAPPRSRR